MIKMKNTTTPLPILPMSESEKTELFYQIAEKHQFSFREYKRLTGGDINEVFLLKGQDSLVLKLNDAQAFPGMFEAESRGLHSLKSTEAIDVPAPIATGTLGKYSYLLVEYRETAPKSSNFWTIFGEQLARLHRNTSKNFGFEDDNYIGSLPQHNDFRKNCADFYLDMRLVPQIDMAEKQGFHLPISEAFYKNCRQLLPDEPPALIHGDLWNGNFLVNAAGQPCLIDPATAYAPREMDLAMMQLFGGFSPELFNVYLEEFPLPEGWKQRIPLWQLYYLLVHLNIFGSSYLGQVTSIIKSFS